MKKNDIFFYVLAMKEKILRLREGKYFKSGIA